MIMRISAFTGRTQQICECLNCSCLLFVARITFISLLNIVIIIKVLSLVSMGLTLEVKKWSKEKKIYSNLERGKYRATASDNIDKIECKKEGIHFWNWSMASE